MSLDKHLELIQSVVGRLANNSFSLKSWSIAILSALIAGASSIQADAQPFLGWLTLLITLLFWGLDAYYLRQERLFRKLYDAVRKGQTDERYTMNIQPYTGDVSPWLMTFFSVTLLPFHLPLFFMALAINLWPMLPQLRAWQATM
ncbi:MAG: hypothetical protein AAGA48_02995 [Myxococcota bacterium]